MSESSFHILLYLQGPRTLSEQSKLALAERNIDAKIILKVVLKSWDYDIFGTTAHFYKMHTVRPLLDQMPATLGFKKRKLGFCLTFTYFWFWFWGFMAVNLLVIKDWLIMMRRCFIFGVNWRVFASLLKIIVTGLKIYFSELLQKLAELQQNQTIYWFFEASCHFYHLLIHTCSEPKGKFGKI